MRKIFEVYVTKVEDRVTHECKDVNEWMSFPMCEYEFEENIGISMRACRLEISDVVYKVENFPETLKDWLITERENAIDLEEIAELLEDFDDEDFDLFYKLVDEAYYMWRQAVNIISTGRVTFYEASDREELGYILADGNALPDHIRNYVDYDEYARDVMLDRGGFERVSDGWIVVD
jgi:hypothetical protein